MNIDKDVHPAGSTPPQRPTSQATSTSWSVAVVLALVTAGLSVINPALLIFVPLAFLLIAVPPRKPLLVVAGLILLAVALVGDPNGTLWWFGRGWVLILSGWFVLAVALLPHLSLTMRALSAIGGASASVAMFFLVNRSGWQSVDFAAGQQLRNAAADVRAMWTARLQDREWASDMNATLDRFAEWQAAAYPALLAIASFAALALGWWLWRRLVSQDPRPLGPLREFRFSDHLVWIAIAGLMLVVMPLNAPATRAGANLLVFMAALYALRGVAVMLALFGTPGFWGVVFGGIVFLLLYPIVMTTTLMVGLTDTWLDLRARQKNEKS